MNVEAINDEWFYDDITTRGVSFDGFLPQACKTPLGNIPLGNTPEFELIHTPGKMADFQNNDWYRKNWKLGDTMLTFSPLQPDKHILVDDYRREMAKILSCPCDSKCCKHDASCGAWPTRGSCRGLSTLCEDVSRYGDVLTGSNVLDDGKIYDVKKEIYRLTDRVFAALAKCYEVDASGTFAILDELYRRKIISSEARDNFASAAAIAIKLRISTYLKAGKQEEQLMASSNEETGKLTSVYYMPNNEELFHFFFIGIPLYEELQQLKAAGNIPPSLTHSSFYDDSDVTMGHIYCRLLNYDEALKCYDRTLQQDQENLSVEIRRISIALCITKDTEEMDKIRENLDTLLCKIDQSWSEPNRETTPFVNRLDFEEIRQLLEVLLLASSFFDCPKYFDLVENIIVHNLAVDGTEKEMLVIVIAFIKHSPESSEQPFLVDFLTFEITCLIDKEGVSTKSILWLNRLGEFLYEMHRIDKAYLCFQRALSMERLLYQTKPNMHLMTSLYFLGITSFFLSMYSECKFYGETLVHLFDSFGGPNARLMVKMTYFQLACLGGVFGNSAEEVVCYLEKALKATTGSRNDAELRLDCIVYCELAVTWHAQHNQEQAWKSALDGKACLGKIVEVLIRAHMTSLVAETLAKIQKSNEGIQILKEEVQKLTSQSETREKALCLMKLGTLCLQQGLASDAENYYKQALEVVVDIRDSKHIFDMLECRFGLSKAIMMDNRVSEAKTVMDETFILAKKLHASIQKVYFVQDVGRFCESLGYISRAGQCLEEALRTYKELSNVAGNPPVVEVSIEMWLAELAKKACAIDSVNPDIAMQAQRSHYDRAAEALRQHVATGQVESITVGMFLSLAVEYKSIDLREAIKLLLEALNVSEIVYGKNKSNEKVTKILQELSNAYMMTEEYNTEDFQASIKYRELLKNKSNEKVTKILQELSNAYMMTEEYNTEDFQASIKYRELLINVPDEVESFPDASLNPESPNLEEKQLLLRTQLRSRACDAIIEYNRKKRNAHQTAKMHTSLQADELPFYEFESSPFDPVDKLISDAIRAKAHDRLSHCIRSSDFALQRSPNWRRKIKILKLRGECYLTRRDLRTAAINFNEAVCVYSSETVGNRDDLCAYSEVAIRLIKSEMLCQNVAGAWVKCQEAIKLVSNHEHRESVHLQEIELLYLGAKCLDILSKNAESKDDKLAQACSLCQQALFILRQATNANEQAEEYGSFGSKEILAFCEVQLLSAAVLLKLHEEENADNILEMLEVFLINITDELEFISMAEGKPEFLKTPGRILSCIGQVLVMRDKIKQSITWLSESLLAFFSAALPDMFSFYEEFLPLLQAITVTKSSGTSHERRSPFQQAVDMCKEVSVKHCNDLNDVYEFLKTLANLYMGLGRTEEAIVVAETGLEICDLMGDNNVTDRINNRGRMLLYLAQMHQLNSSNSAFDRNKELNLAEHYYLTDQDSAAEFVLQKNLSYANFLCEQKRFAEANAVLQDMNNLGKELSDKFVYCAYFSRVFYGPGIQKSIEVDGELLSTVEHCMYSTMVRVFVGMGKKGEAVAACEKLTANPVVVHDAIYGKRPSSIPYLIEAWHRELLSLLSDEDQKQLQNCEFPLSPANIFKLYYMLNEYTLALKYYTNETQSPDLIEMKMSCLRLAGNELVEMDRGNESHSYFTQFFAMLQTKDGFLDKPFHAQCETLARYSFANQYYIFRSLGKIMAFERGNLDGAIQCYERCLELDEDLTLGQDLVATLAEFYQSKALTVDIENQDSCKRQMNLALDLFQKLLQKNAELIPCVECSFGSLLLKLERYHEAVEHFENVIKRADDEPISATDVNKPLFDVYLRREIETSGIITIPIKVQAFYELILTYMKLNEVGKAQEVALRLENYVERFQRTPKTYLALSIVGYANKLIGNKEKAAEIFVSVLEIIPGHLCSTVVRAFVEMGKKREAVAACEKLTANLVVFHDAIHGKRPSSIPYLIEACHRELLSLLSDEDQKQLQNCEFPLSQANIFKLYYMLNEYSLALKYYTNETQSSDLIEMKISCLRLAGNELVEMDRGNEALLCFVEFLRMLQTKEGFLDKPFHAQCATLARYSFAKQYYIFRLLGVLMACERGNLDGAIQCYERCLELHEDLTLGQDLAASLADFSQSKALTVDIKKQYCCKRQMNLVLYLVQKLFKKTAELTPFVECSFGSLLLKLERYHEAVQHFENVIKREDHEAMECTDVDKPLFDVYLRREIEASGRIAIPVKVRAFYELILTYMKLNEVGKAQEVALRLENYVERFQRTPETYLTLSIVGYANKLIGNKEKAAEIFVSVLEIIPGHLCSTVVRAFVEMEQKREAVSACEKLTASPVAVHDAIHEKRPSITPHLIEACHRELLSLLSDEDRKQLQNCEFPLSPPNIFKLYYMLNEYSLALKYYTNETQSPDLIEMKISCLCLAGNELVQMDRGNESYSYFTQFLAMLQTKEGFLDKPVHAQCATLARYSFANQYYIFRSLGEIMASQRGNLDGAIQCYQRCLELDEDLFLDDQNLVATLANLYQSKALTVDIKYQDSSKRQMNLALNLFQKLLKKTAELTPFVECWFGSLLLKLERYHEAVEHFENVIKREDDELLVYRDIDKPLFDVYLRREIEASGSITIPVKVRAFYELILTYMKLNEVGKAQEVALRLENYVELFQRTSKTYLALSIVGYANKLIGNKEKAADIFVSVLEIIPEHLCSTMVRVFVEMGKKKEAVAACEKLTANPVVVRNAIHKKRPSSILYLIKACHRDLLFLLSDEDRKQLQNCEFPLSPANIFKLYYMLNEYTLALKYYTNETHSPDLIEMKISCLRLAGNELVEMDRGDESDSYFLEFLAMLQTKEAFLDKPFHAQCATLAGYSFANQFYIFRSFGDIMAHERGNLDGASQCYERCLELDEALTLDQSLVATLADLYQSKALTVDIENQDSCKRQMKLALDLFQKLLQKTAELTPFVECSFGSLLLKLERYHEAVECFENAIKRADDDPISATDIDKPLFDVYLRREIEVGGSITIPVKVQAFYELILTYMKLNEVGKAQEVVLRLENYVERLRRIPEFSLCLSIVGYANKLIGKKEKAAEIFVSVLEINPGHLPVTEALESLSV